MNDIIVKGSIAGTIGALGDFIIHQVSYLLFGASTTVQYIAQLIFHKERFLLHEHLAGLLVHLITGAIAGILLMVIFKATGKDHPYYKGIGLGGILWVFHVAVIPNIINTPMKYILRSGIESYVDLVSHIVFGLLATWFILKTLLPVSRT